jgi:hypothetical protein
LAHRRPGYPSVGLLASRARLRFTRQQEGSTPEARGKGGRLGQRQEKKRRGEEGASAAIRRLREGEKVAPGGPGLTVGLVTVRVP